MKKLLAITLGIGLLSLPACSTKSLDTAQKVAKYNRIASEIVDVCLSATTEDSQSLGKICAEVKLLATGDADPDYTKLASYVVGVVVDCLAAEQPDTAFSEACIEIKEELAD